MKKNKKPFILDGVQINAAHFVAMGKEEAIKKMEKDKVTVPEGQEADKFYAEAYAKMEQYVKPADTQSKATTEAQSTEAPTIAPEVSADSAPATTETGRKRNQANQ